MPEYLETKHSYSSAVKAGDHIFLGLHRGKGETFQEQLETAIVDVSKSLGHFGCKISQLVKIHVYLRSIDDLNKMEVYFGKIFQKGAYPARMTTTTEFCDEDCMVMLDGIAYLGGD